MRFNNESTQEELRSALDAAGYAASSKFYDKNPPPVFSTEMTAGTDMEEYHAAAAQSARAAKELVLSEWYKTPQGAEEKREAEEAALEAEKERLKAENIAYEQRKEQNRLYLVDLAHRRQTYAVKNGFEDWSACVAHIVASIRYRRAHPWLAWMTCAGEPEPDSSLGLCNKLEPKIRHRYC